MARDRGERPLSCAPLGWPSVAMDSYRVSEKVAGVQVPQLEPEVAATVAVVAVVVIE